MIVLPQLTLEERRKIERRSLEIRTDFLIYAIRRDGVPAFEVISWAYNPRKLNTINETCLSLALFEYVGEKYHAKTR